MNKNMCVCLMAGGVGSRFWPASKEACPKQFLDINGRGSSLLEQTVERFVNMGVDIERIFIISNELYIGQIQSFLPNMPAENIVGEPGRRNTAPAALLGTLIAEQKFGPCHVVMSPVDHHIAEEEKFQEVMDVAANFIQGHDGILTIGIKPRYAHTGYGYIEYDLDNPSGGVHSVRKFTEKPDRKTAETFVQAGNYLWNGGLFLWSSTYLKTLYSQLAPDMLTLFNENIKFNGHHIDQTALKVIYDAVEDISIDYKILEPCTEVFTLPASFGWSDLGSWNAVYDLLKKADGENITIGSDIIADDATGNLIRSENKKIIVSGLHDFMIVEAGEFLVIAPRSKDQDVKFWRSKAGDKFGNDCL